jgi:hypothetical protein
MAAPEVALAKILSQLQPITLNAMKPEITLDGYFFSRKVADTLR